ncbi:MAG: RNA 2',3'-cyclic phosphodiesterase [Nitrospirales bacterium]
MIRVFLAVELSSGIRENLFSFQQELKKTLPPVNWVRPESIHLTMKFLGFVEASRISQLLLALEPVGTTQYGFSIEIQGVGVFPHVKHPKILWVGITGQTQALHELVLEIEAALEPLGFPPEEKPYHPHLTLARIKRDNALVGSALLENGVLARKQHFSTFTVDRLTLFQSKLDSTGATYTPLGVVPLSQQSPGL